MKHKKLLLSALGLPIAITGMAMLDVEAVNEQDVSTRATASINNYKIENVTDEGFDFIIKFNSDIEVISTELPYWKEGNYNGMTHKNDEVQKVGTNEFKLHIKMKDIGSGTEYIYIGIHPRFADGTGMFIADISIKLDSITPELTLSSSNTNWTNQNISVKAVSKDNQNIIEKIYFGKAGANKTTTNVFSSPKMLLIQGYSSSGFADKYRNNPNVTIVQGDTITSANQLKGYDIVLYDGRYWGIEDNVSNAINQAFEEGVSIITNLNDSPSNLSIATGTTGQYGGEYTFRDYTNNTSGYQKGRNNRFAYLMNGRTEGDSGYHTTNLGSGTFMISDKTHNDGSYASVGIAMKTHSNGNKWIHAQSSDAFFVSGTLDRAIDEIMHGIMKSRQNYNNSFEVSENGTYEVEVEDFSGNKAKKSITVSNIDKVAPTMTITGNPTSWIKQATLTATGSDNLSGVKQIVLPNGTVVNGSSANYTITANGNYTFKIIDNAGNETTQTVNVTKIDNSVNAINKVKSDMTHLNEATSSRRITMTFTGVSDNQSGLKGYSYVIDKNPSTIPDNNINTTSTTITKDITDTGKYYLHIKAIDNIGNVSSVKHFEIEVPALANKINSSGTVDLTWTMNATDQPYTYSIMRKRGDESGYTALGNSELRDSVNVLNIHPNAGAEITYTTWDGETITDVKSSSLKQWMEQPNSENPKGYGMGIIEVIPITLDDFNTNPNTYLYKATSGANNGKYVTNIRGKEEVIDVVMFGTWDANASKDISESGVENIKAFLDDNGAVLFGHDTLHYAKNFWEFAPYADVKKQNPLTSSETGTSLIVGGTHIQANREGLITKYPWNVGNAELTVPSTHTSYQMVNDKNTWMRFSRPSDGIIPPSLQNAGWVERLIQSDGYSNDAYLAINKNVGQIQTGHTGGSATPDEQKVLANALFYMTQLTTTTEKNKTDEVALDVNNPTNTKVTEHEFLNNASQIKFNFTASTDVGTDYSYYVKAEGQDDGANRLSNTVKNTITSGIKGYSFVVDNNPNTAPDNTVDTTTTSVTIDNNKGNNLYLHIKSIDNAGNVSETTHYNLSDTTKPTMTITGNPTSWTNKDVTLNITANDTGSGIRHIVLPNGNIVSGYNASYTVTANGNYTFKAVDKMGNEISQTITVNKIDKSINNVVNLKTTMEMLNTTNSQRNIIATFNPVSENNQSGLKGYSYVIDKNPSTVPDNTVNTTSTRIEHSITDTGVYYLHIKAIDNVGNNSNVIHHKIDIPKLTGTVDNVNNKIRLDWTMDDINNKTFKVYQNKEGSDTFQSISTTDFDINKQIKVLNVYPSKWKEEAIAIESTYTTWDGEVITGLPKSASLKKWMEEPNVEHPKGYGQGIIEVTPVNIADFNLNPDNYLKNTKGDYNYDVVMFGTWDSNGYIDLSALGSEKTKLFLESGRGVLFGHDTTNQANFKKLRSFLNVQFPGDSLIPSSYNDYDYVVSSDEILKNKIGLLTNTPWNIDTDRLYIPYAHTSQQYFFGDVWFKFDNTRAPVFPQYGNNEVSVNGATNNAYLSTYNNGAMIQTGHSNGLATADEQKILANTLFYLNQLSTDNYLEDYSGQDIKSPDMPQIYEHNFTEDGFINLNFNSVNDNGSTYKYYVESQTKDNDSLTLSNVVSETITSGLKGYSFVIDSKADTIPDDIIEITKAETIKLKTDSNKELYVHIKAIDNAGNSSETYHYSITDMVKPVISVTKSPSSWTNGSVVLTATATDTGSGVKYMILPNGNKVSASTVSYTVDKNGIYYFRVIDYMGNEAVVSVIVDNIDKKKPTVTINNNQNWTNKDVEVTITSDDD